jgi:hypothetical protein
MISRVLSDKYNYLDNLNKKKNKAELQSKRSSIRDWPDLKGALFEWQ